MAISFKSLVMPRLIPILHASLQLFMDLTESKLISETIETHQEFINGIGSRLRSGGSFRCHVPVSAT